MANIKVFSFFFLLIICSASSFASPSRILIIRHAEKTADPNDPHLSSQGLIRAKALASLFSIHPEYALKGTPSAIFAAHYIPGKNSNRSIETATPLAESLSLKVQTPFVGSDADKLAQLILQSKDLSEKVVFIAWVHGNIPSLAAAFGASCPEKWDGSEVFDRIWMLDFTSAGITCTDLPESVVPGDSK